MAIDDNGTGAVDTPATATATPCTSATSIPPAPGLEVFKVHERRQQAGAWLRRRPHRRRSSGTHNTCGVRQRPRRGRRHLRRQRRRRVLVVGRHDGPAQRRPARTSAASPARPTSWSGGTATRCASCSTAPTSTSTAPAATPACSPAAACTSNNGTKATPALSGDIFGDWREEVIWRDQRQHARCGSTPPPTPTDHPHLHAAARPAVPRGDRLAEHRLQPAAAPELLHRRRHGDAAARRTS